MIFIKFLCNIELLLILSYIIKSTKSLSEDNFFVYIEKDFTGKNATLNSKKCNSPLPEEFDKSISSIDTRGNCLHLYKDLDCLGEDYIIMEVGSPDNRDLKKWNAFNYQVRSIGPCVNKCNLTDSKQSTKVILFEHNTYKGHHAILDVKGCQIVPLKLHRSVWSIKLEDKACIQMYESWDCSGKSIRIPSGMGTKAKESGPDKFYKEIWKFWHWMYAVSISNCGYNCNNQTQMYDEESTIRSLGQNIVTIYSKSNYQGPSKNIDVSDGCIDIADAWEGEAMSIQTEVQLAIYDRFGCNDDGNVSKKFVIAASVRNLQEITFDYQIRSMKLYCSGQSCHPNKNNILLPVILTASSILLVLLSAVIIVITLKLKRAQRKKIIIPEKEIEDFIQGNGDYSTEPLFSMDRDNLPLPAYSQPYDTQYEIPKENITIDLKSTLGTGQYAIVYRGVVKRSDEAGERVVAIKTVKPFCGIDYVRTMLREIKTMIFVGNHPRIVELIGCCTENLKKAELYIVTELCAEGSLVAFLRSNRDKFCNLVEADQISMELITKQNTQGNVTCRIQFNTLRLLQWCLDIVEGMEYLASKKVIHGDLATRNVLLDENFNVKISDFGLSKQLYQYTQYIKSKQVPMPWAWLAIESLKTMEFSTESDVWAFGVTSWEIFTLAEVPYVGMVCNDSFFTSLCEGLRLSKPKYSTSEWYNLMLSCWKERPSERIRFPELRVQLQVIHNKYNTALNKPSVLLATTGYVAF